MNSPQVPAQVPFQQLRADLLRIAYEDPDELDETRHGAFQQALQEAARAHAAVYALVVTGPQIRVVDPAFGMFWSRMLGTLGGRFKAGAVVTRSLGVRATAAGVALTLKLTANPFELRTFPDEPAARQWLEAFGQDRAA